jgi:hypothetical protein
MAADIPSTIVRMSAPELRRLFNEAGYWEQVNTGLLREVAMKERHPSPEPSGEPACTRSQMISYRDRAGHEVARVHQYLRPDGTLGGSGKPDPKRLCHGGAIYIAG